MGLDTRASNRILDADDRLMQRFISVNPKYRVYRMFENRNKIQLMQIFLRRVNLIDVITFQSAKRVMQGLLR